jgi:hypothetical protein
MIGYRGVLLIMTMSDPQRDQATQERIQELQWEFLEHLPYSLSLAPSDFHLFGLLKKHLGSKCFADDEEVEMEVCKWLRQVSFDTLAKRWDKYINVGAGYVMK